jgi:hypothetical protein
MNKEVIEEMAVDDYDVASGSNANAIAIMLML